MRANDPTRYPADADPALEVEDLTLRPEPRGDYAEGQALETEDRMDEPRGDFAEGQEWQPAEMRARGDFAEGQEHLHEDGAAKLRGNFARGQETRPRT